MKLTIKTVQLQNLVSRAVKGCSNDGSIMLTSLMEIKLEENTLSLTTTDMRNYLTVSADKVAGDNFYVVVNAEQFSKLISRMTCEELVLELTDNLKITGNGSYTIELPLDEEGRPIVFPHPEFDVDSASKSVVNLSTIRTILDTAKSALAKDINAQCYTGYYLGDNIVATDTFKICGIDIKLFDRPVLLASTTMDLLDVMTSETINVFTSGSKLLFDTEDCYIIADELFGVKDFAIEPITGLINSEFDSCCELSKSAVLQTLDRLSLFVSPYDRNGIYLTFTRDGLIISSKKSNGSEKIEYMGSENFKDFTCCINIEMLRSQVKANASDKLKLHYGLENCIKLTEGNVTQVIALIEDDRM